MTRDGIRPFDWIDVSLALGGRLDMSVVPALQSEHGLGFVVDVRSEAQDDPVEFQRHGIEVLLVPTDDHHAISEAMLARGVAWVRERLQAGGKVYIHCEHGIGRSVLLACCVLVSLGRPTRDALQHIKSIRPCASPSPAQLHALLAFARRYEEPLPSWDELADIAYAHVPGRKPSAR